MKKAIFLLVAVVMVVTTGMTASCTGTKKPTGPLEKVTIGISATSLLASLVHIAEERGYFLEEGIDVEVKGYPTGKDALAATLSGELDMGTVGDTPIVSNSFERDDFDVNPVKLDQIRPPIGYCYTLS